MDFVSFSIKYPDVVDGENISLKAVSAHINYLSAIDNKKNITRRFIVIEKNGFKTMDEKTCFIKDFNNIIGKNYK